MFYCRAMEKNPSWFNSNRYSNKRKVSSDVPLDDTPRTSHDTSRTVNPYASGRDKRAFDDPITTRDPYGRIKEKKKEEDELIDDDVDDDDDVDNRDSDSKDDYSRRNTRNTSLPRSTQSRSTRGALDDESSQAEAENARWSSSDVGHSGRRLRSPEEEVRSRRHN
jgi:hypothetical protein